MNDALMAATDALDAECVLDSHRGAVMKIAGPIIEGLIPDLDDFPKRTQDDILATRVAKALDNLLVLPEPWETLSDAVLWLVARGAIAVYREIERFRKRLGKRIGNLENRLDELGSTITAKRRLRIERRISRMERRLARRTT